MEQQDQQITPISKAKAPFTSVILPAHNESEGIETAVTTVSDVLESCTHDWEILVIDDGSEDETFARLQELAAQDSRVRAIRFSRNFGKEAAILAGLQHAGGDVVITMDADLQHPPELIPEMLRRWSEGARVVNAVKRGRATDGVIARLRANIFNSLISTLGGIEMHDASDYKLLDRVVVDQVAGGLPERERFYRGLTDWVGYKTANLQFDVHDRVGGEGKWSILKLAELALTALVSFTSAPLRIVTLLGIATLALGFFIGVDALISWARGNSVSGFATIVITLLLIGSFVMISLGIMGEYIAKIYEEVKRRPTFIIESTTDADESQTD
jgi:glycosyltransferase involved in cell wall biosynthesis